jgi:hypothetical protein
MAFLSDAHFSSSLASDRSSGARRRRLNWRLLLALAVNLLAWAAIIRVIAAIL